MARVINCPYCNTLNVRPYAARMAAGSPHNLRVVCRDCGLVFANPQATPSELRSFYQNYYDRGNFQHWKEETTAWKTAHAAGKRDSSGRELYRVASRIFRTIPSTEKTPRWLEIGAGLGSLSYLAKDYGLDVTATDLDSDAVEFMRSTMGIDQVHCGDVVELPLEAGTYDIVVIHHVLEHVTDLFGTLNAAHRVLRPGGVLFIGVPNLASVGYTLYRGSAFLTFRIPSIVDGVEHTFGFTPRTLRQCLQKAGYEVQHIRAFGRGSNLSDVLTVGRRSGLKKALVAVAQSIFHVKMECCAIRSGK